MKLVPALLAASLAANLALAVFVQVRRSSPADRPPGDALSANAPGPSATASPRHGSADTAAEAPASLASGWVRLRGAGDTGFVARLEAAGFPPQIIRALVRVEVAARHAGRQREIDAMRAQLPWWRNMGFGTMHDTEVYRAQRELGRAMDDDMTKLLGVSPSLYTPEDRAGAIRRYGDLPLETITRLQTIERDYGELQAELRAETQGVLFAADRERFDLLEQEKRRDMAALLTPAELAEFDRRSSATAARLRGQLREFEPTETEYLALYEITRPLDEKLSLDGQRTAASEAARRAAEQELAPAIAAALGPERYEEYQLKTSGAYQWASSLLNPIAHRFGLNPEASTAVIKQHIALSDRAAQIARDPALDPAQREAQVAALVTEASTSLATLLGSAEAFGHYLRSPLGRWMQPRPPSGRTPPPPSTR